MDHTLQHRETMRKVLQFHLKQAQERMKQLANRRRSDKEFAVVEAKVGYVSYRLQLPPTARIHPTFHVSQLKKHVGSAISSLVLPPVGSNDAILKEPIKVLERHMVKKRNQAATKVLIEWANTFSKDATWENLKEIQ
ncbi:uncharacterized protein LOC108451643 [Gossypium arboreum]|uniref:uncharacterized protein LOC108451643 n=1 Tax=Gossypium arboreum TaxID=29729 RepID=UPI00081922E7|nr:uncharacterized protein LOC108451643 [Gossypium arboreum]